MTTAPVALPLSAARDRAEGWGARLAEFLAVGGATLLILPLGWLLRATIGLDSADYAFGFSTF